MSDEIRLALPAEEDFREIAHLVVGGLGARLDLTLEQLEDVQVGLEALLQQRDDDEEISIVLAVDDARVHATVGPFAAGALAELAAFDGHGLADEPQLGLQRVLETVCDSVEVEERGGAWWVELTKRTTAPAGATG